MINLFLIFNGNDMSQILFPGLSIKTISNVFWIIFCFLNSMFFQDPDIKITLKKDLRYCFLVKNQAEKIISFNAFSGVYNFSKVYFFDDLFMVEVPEIQNFCSNRPPDYSSDRSIYLEPNEEIDSLTIFTRDDHQRIKFDFAYAIFYYNLNGIHFSQFYKMFKSKPFDLHPVSMFSVPPKTSVMFLRFLLKLGVTLGENPYY